MIYRARIARSTENRLVSMPHTVADCSFRDSHSASFRMRRLQRKAALWIALLCSLGGAFIGPFATATNAAPTDYQLKAVFLYNFTRFIEWPETAFSDPAGDLIIGVLGEDPFGADLDRVTSGEMRDRHAVTIVRYKDIDDIGPCHILFISASQRPKLPAILKKLHGSSVLTVADEEGLARKGVMINLITADNRVKMDINLKAATAAGLTLSSKLLRAATVVDPSAEQ
jgi:hypothetical protein